nr:putative ribonuclease h protein [Quercus suber]
MFSHDDKECEIWLKSKGALTAEHQQFGHWIRANPFGSNRSRSIEVKGFEPRQPRSRGRPEQRKDGVFEQGVQSNEGICPGGGEETETAAAKAKDINQNVSVSNKGTGFRGLSDFEAKIAEIDKEISLNQPLSNPGDLANEQQTNGNFLGGDERGDPTDNIEGLLSLQSAQIPQSMDCQSREVGVLGSTTGQLATDGEKKCAKVENNETIKVSGELGKIGIGPGPQSEEKKGQWTRIINRSNSALREEVMHGAVGIKRKAKEIEGSEESNTEKEKKQKTEEETKKLTRLWFYSRGSFRSPNALSILNKCGLKSKAAMTQSKVLGKLFLQIRPCLELFRMLIIVKPSCKSGLKGEVAELLRMEEKMWHQRSDVHWIVSRDKNTSYFHNRASQRFPRNSILELKDPQGRLYSGNEEVSGMIVDSPILHLTPESTLDSLIDPATGWWNINLIDWCFHPPDAKLIKSLPLSSIPQLDTLVWSFEKLGNYSVKSGYKLLCELHNLDINRPQVSESQKGFWKSIWKLKVPGKIKQFLWRACTNSLPTKDNLLKRKILHESACPRCTGEPESVVHALWSCACDKAVWDMDFDWVDRSSTAMDSFSEVFQKVQARPASVPLFTATAWSIWYQRNKTRLQDNPLPLRNVAGFARNYLSEFRGMDRPCVQREWAGPHRWIPPVSDIVKINYDGAIFGLSTGLVSTGLGPTRTQPD